MEENLSKNKESHFECNNDTWHTITCHSDLNEPINGVCVSSVSND